MKPIRIALTKGRLEKDSIAMFERLGYDCTAVREKGRAADSAGRKCEYGGCARQSGRCGDLC